jgi:hypothetical protein
MGPATERYRSAVEVRHDDAEAAMSGYGGRPPSDWQGPYGQNPYGQDPYGPYGQQPQQQPYGQPGMYGQPDPYGLYGPPGIPPTPPANNAAAVAAIVANCFGLLIVCGIGIAWLPGMILGGFAVNKIQSDPAAARTLTRWSWICCGLNFVIEAVIFGVWYLSTH